jgi:nucleotide-binding universal stress UspA family protein
MGSIVCATRGGEDSRRTQERAIDLARTRGDALTFIFVADTAFTPPTRQALTEVVADELARLGSRLLGIAQARAREQGVDAGAVVRCGAVWPTLATFLAEVKATTLVMGVPHGHAPPRTSSPDEVRAFADDMRAMGIEVVIVE